MIELQRRDGRGGPEDGCDGAHVQRVSGGGGRPGGGGLVSHSGKAMVVFSCGKSAKVGIWKGELYA